MKKFTAGIFAAILTFASAWKCWAEIPSTQPDAAAEYVRCIDLGPSGGELDTADVTFVNDSGVHVHLLAAVHIADPQYYQKLGEDFQTYDAVLYELIKPRDQAPPSGDGQEENPSNLISRFQIFLKDTLNLEYQLDAIDYTRPNFVHADLDKETFEQMESDRGESIWTLMLKEMSADWNSPPPVTDQDMSSDDMVRFLLRPDGERRLKMVFAHQMDQIETVSTGLGGPEGSVILTERNKAAINVLEQTLAAGKKKIAIFYGAAHMPDLAQRLEERGFRPVDRQWRLAWDMRYRLDQPSNAERAVDAVLDQLGNSTGNN